MCFAENLKNAREAMDLSVEELAVQIKAAPKTVTAWESGESYPLIDEMKRLSKILKYEADTLISPDEMDRYVDFTLSGGSASSDLGDLLMVASILAGLAPGFITGRFAFGVAGVVVGLIVGFLLRKLWSRIASKSKKTA